MNKREIIIKRCFNINLNNDYLDIKYLFTTLSDSDTDSFMQNGKNMIKIESNIIKSYKLLYGKTIVTTKNDIHECIYKLSSNQIVNIKDISISTCDYEDNVLCYYNDDNKFFNINQDMKDQVYHYFYTKKPITCEVNVIVIKCFEYIPYDTEFFI